MQAQGYMHYISIVSKCANLPDILKRPGQVRLGQIWFNLRIYRLKDQFYAKHLTRAQRYWLKQILASYILGNPLICFFCEG